LEQLKRQAKLLRDFVRVGAPQALEMVAEFHPAPPDLDPGSPAVTGFRLTTAQLVVARRHGFASWAKLRAHLGVIDRYRRSPHQAPPSPDLPDEFLRLACLTHGGGEADSPEGSRRAARLLEARPDVTAGSIHVAAAAGDVEAARHLLDDDPARASEEGGPHRWEPLLYLAYSTIDDRVAARSHLEVASLLLGAGADPNAGYLWEGLPSPYTVLTGVLTGGHRERLALGRLLLDAGAEANDAQLMYELGFAGDDPGPLELLYEFGLGRGEGGVWHRRLGSSLDTPAQLVEDELIRAAAGDWPRRLRLVLAHPVRFDGLGSNHPIFEGLTAYEHAVMRGNAAATAILDGAGVRPLEPDPVRDFIGACMLADRATVERMKGDDPSIVERAKARRPHQICVAADLDRFDAVKLLIEVGFDVNATYRWPHEQSALHGAAFHGNLEMVRYLVDHGADVTAEDCSFHATPRGWAEHAGHPDTVAYFDGLAGPSA
jgi:hypothetical protein